MKPPTDELLDLCSELDAEPPRSGFTGGLDLYDALMNFTAPSSDERPQAGMSDEMIGVTWQMETVDSPLAEPATVTGSESAASPIQHVTTGQGPTSESPSVRPAAESGPLSHTDDVIRITSTLTGFVVSQTATVTCGECGNSTNGSEMFCNHCGGLIDGVAASAEANSARANLCDDCGGVIENDEIFCPSCGSVMAAL